MQQVRLYTLVKNYLSGSSSEAEKQELLLFIDSSPDEELGERLQVIWNTYEDAHELPADDSQRIIATILAYKKTEQRPVHRVHFLKTAWSRYAAAIIIVVLGVASYLWFKPSESEDNKTITPYSIKNDIAPGGNKATLTLADGSVIVLDNAVNGELAQQGGAKVSKLGTGIVSYKGTQNGVVPSNVAGGKVTYNVINTPRGGQYQVVLPDGSKVWLNAASGLRFPTSFIEAARKVEVTGEAYFEIVANKYQPFMVTANGTQVQVLGTSFNVNAYPDEASLNTTLLEGTIKVIKDDKAVLLSPGMQARVSNSGQLVLYKNADVNKVMAWKNGWFNFKDTDLASAMREVERWYDIEVLFKEKELAKEQVVARIERDVSLSKLIRLLELTGKIHATLEGRKIIITR